MPVRSRRRTIQSGTGFFNGVRRLSVEELGDGDLSSAVSPRYLVFTLVFILTCTFHSERRNSGMAAEASWSVTAVYVSRAVFSLSESCEMSTPDEDIVFQGAWPMQPRQAAQLAKLADIHESRACAVRWALSRLKDPKTTQIDRHAAFKCPDKQERIYSSNVVVLKVERG